MSKEHVRLIDANALKKRVVKVMFRDCPESGEFYAVGTDDIDIMPILRCKDGECRWLNG